jgi:hypothetical protein
VCELRLKIIPYAEVGTKHYQHTSPNLAGYNPRGGVTRRTLIIQVIALNLHGTYCSLTALNKLRKMLLNKSLSLIQFKYGP